MGRTLVIGDIHGGKKALVQILVIAQVTKKDRLIFLGDYVDGWSESAQTIEYLIELSRQIDCVFMKGNHDAWCEQWLRTGEAQQVWLDHGGPSTIESYAQVSSQKKAFHLDFFKALQNYYIDDHNRLFVHAGFTAITGVLDEPDPIAFTMDRTLWEMAMSIGSMQSFSADMLPARLRLYREIFIGHTPTIIYHTTLPLRQFDIWNLDTGSAFTGKLTIMDIDSKQYWQSDFVRKLYPGEKGRNRS